MNVVRLVNLDAVRPIHVVTLCLLAATVAGSCLLTCGPNAMLEGAADWSEESPLRAIVHVLNLNYSQTTARGVEIKLLILGVGAALAAVVLGLSLAVRPSSLEETADEDTVLEERTESSPPMSLIRRPIPPLAAAQVLAALYVLWSFASCQWSSAPDLALGGSTFLAFGVVWAVATGRCLNRPTATVGGYVLLCICVATAALAIAYYDERNPTRRASYPMGNPLFLAACLIPGVLVSVGVAGAALQSLVRRVRASHAVIVLACVASVCLIVWAGLLTGSRSAAIATFVGLLAMAFFILRGPAKIAVLVVTLALGVFGAWFYIWPQLSAPSSTGRDASLRVRAYAWSYAVSLIDEAPVLGHGQGGFAQHGDGYAATSGDVLLDPSALEHRIAHAHNEWLEVWANLGLVGFMLVAGMLCSTLWAGMAALRETLSPYRRWVLAALMASLVALIVEQSADVALRIAGLPAVFYSVIGLIWALSRRPELTAGRRWEGSLWARRAGGIGAGGVGLVLLLAALMDFGSARAEFESERALQERSYAKAVGLAERASRWRLSPSRRLEAMEWQCRSHIYIAREYQTSCLDRFERGRRSDPPDEHLLFLAQQDREKSEAHIAAARDAWKELSRRSPYYFGLGWLEYRLYQLGGVFAQLDGDERSVEDKHRGAVEALARELRRQPYDPIVALSYVEMVGAAAPLVERLHLLARPLRLGAIPPEYSAFLWGLADRPAIDQELPLLNLDGRGPTPDVPASDDPFLPEALRLAANIHFLRADYARAVETAQGALMWYDRLEARPSLGRAGCRYELAEYTFFMDPGRWHESIEHAERAIEALPDSTPGRQMKRIIRERMVAYHLAGNNEEAAGDLVRALYESASEPGVSVELGRRYALFAKSLIRGRRGELPPEFERWVDRAAELAPEYELVWRLKAQLSYNDGDVSKAAEQLRRALARGAEPPVVLGFVNLALAEHPENPDLQRLASELQSVVGPQGAASGSPSPSQVPSEVGIPSDTP